LHNKDETIAVDGFLDGVRLPSEEERADLAAIPFDEDSFYGALGTAPAGEAGFSTLERLWLRPTIEVNGLWGGYTGAGGKTVIPNEAHAKLTMRLVPGQEPGAVVQRIKDHLLRHAPRGARITVGESGGGSGAYELPGDHPLLAAAEEALAATLGSAPLRVRMGASLPMTDIILRELGIHTVMFSFATSDEDYHAPNEFFRLASLDQGLAAWVRLLRELGEQSAALYAGHRR
jgi:acetylornithine deacetylase/succinyl-diaminopimelate desuccinylase-like protein